MSIRGTIVTFVRKKEGTIQRQDREKLDILALEGQKWKQILRVAQLCSGQKLKLSQFFDV